MILQSAASPASSVIPTNVAACKAVEYTADEKDGTSIQLTELNFIDVRSLVE